MSNKNQLRLGVIGCGNILNHAHLPSYLKVDGLQVAGFYDIDIERAKQTCDRFRELVRKLMEENPQKVHIYEKWLDEVKVYDSPGELLDKVDLIDICTPVKWHTTYAIMALERGVHAMSEKPMARSILSARKVVDAARRGNALYQLNDDNLFLPRYQVIKNILESGAIGQVEACWIARGSHGPESRSWFWQPEISGGGCLMDYGTHAVTSLWYLLGYDKKVVRVKSDGIISKHRTRPIASRLQSIHVDDDAHFRVLFEDPATGAWITTFIEATWSWPERGERGDDVSGFIRIIGTDGELTGVIDEEGRNFVKIMKPGYGDKFVPVPYAKSEEGSFVGEITNFAECVRAGQRSILNEEVGLGVMEVLDAAYLSEFRGRRAITIADLHEFVASEAGKYEDEEDAETAIVRCFTGKFGE